MSKFRIVVSAGGTGGHIIPALSVSLELLKQGAEVYYIGNHHSMEQDVIGRHNIPFYAIDVQKIYRAMTFRHLLFPFKLLKSIFACIKHLKKIQPDAFIGFGGYVSGPPAFAAWLLRIPVYLQEQNCRPGLTNRWTGKFATGVFVAHPDSVKYFNKKKTIVSGNPILNYDLGIMNYEGNGEETQARGEHSDKESKTLLILGGSQGSLFINNLVLDNLDFLLQKGYKIIWQTGKKHLEAIKEQLKNSTLNTPPSALHQIELFDFTDDIHSIYKRTDYVITRGGALCLAEIDVYSIPAFIIPLASAAVNEQYHNAVAMEKANKAVVFEEKDKALFRERWDDFIQKTTTMSLDLTPSLHLTAATTIAKGIMDYELCIMSAGRREKL